MLMKNLSDLDIILEVGSEKVKTVMSHILNSPDIQATIELFGQRGVRKNPGVQPLGTKIECVQIDFTFQKLKYRLVLSLNSRYRTVNNKPVYMIVMNVETIGDFNYLYALFQLDKKEEKSQLTDEEKKNLSRVPEGQRFIDKIYNNLDNYPKKELELPKDLSSTNDEKEKNSFVKEKPKITDEFMEQLQTLLNSGILEIDFGLDKSEGVPDITKIQFRSGLRSLDPENDHLLLMEYDTLNRTVSKPYKKETNIVPMKRGPRYLVVSEDNQFSILASHDRFTNAKELAINIASQRPHDNICIVDSWNYFKIVEKIKMDKSRTDTSKRSVDILEDFLGRPLTDQEKEDFQKQTNENQMKHKTS